MKVYNKIETYTTTQLSVVNRYSRDVVSRDLGIMRVGAGRDTWALKTECEINKETDLIGFVKVDSRTAERRSKRK